MKASGIARAALAAAAICGAPALAETYTVTTVTAPTIATVASATTGSTVFTLTTAAGLSVASGNGGIVTGTRSASTVTITCANGGAQGTGNCNAGGVMPLIKIGATGTVGGRGLAPTNFTVASGTATVGSVTTNGDGSIQFTLSNFGGTGGKNFLLAMSMPISGDDVGGTTGAATAQFYVRANKNPTTPTTGLNQNITATVRRSLVVVKNSDLQFGTVVRQTSGSGTVLINNSTGARTTGGGTPPILVSGPAFGRAAFTLTGESGTAFSITVPASFNLTSGANTIAVTTSATATGAQTLTGGTFSLGIGGTITVANTTSTGAYTGSLAITLVYN